ncbi:fimbrial protein [Pseudomonas sp. nanlin1]|uniref:fimbrial protein n=1 Tax=Pseudomonas sp. nanlin1 TaxID=3040605 RepID=UPI00388F4540
MKRIWLVLCFISANVNAADMVTINVRGTLVRPPCQLSSATTLTADFGNVRTDQVEQTATKNLPVTLNCPAGSGLNVSFSSSNGTYTSTVAKTTANNLGVSLLWADNSPANLQGSSKTYNNQSGTVDISLKAQLVKRGDLAPGQFSSAIVMTINYQ